MFYVDLDKELDFLFLKYFYQKHLHFQLYLFFHLHTDHHNNLLN